MFKKPTLKAIPLTISMIAALMLGGIAQAQTGRSGGTGTGMSGSGMPNTSDASGTSVGSGTFNADKQNDKMVNKKAKKAVPVKAAV